MLVLIVLVVAAFVLAALHRRFFGKKFSLTGKHVCVTGGSEGIGLSVAQECVRRGASAITLIARNPDKLQKAVDQLLSTAGPYRVTTDSGTCAVLAFACDVTDAESVGRVFKVIHETGLDKFCASSDSSGQEALKAAKEAGLVVATTTNGDALPTRVRPVDVLVNSAGSCVCDHFEALEPKELQAQLDVNVCGTLYPSREFVLQAKKSPEINRVIVLVGSQSSQVNIYGFVGYGATKFAIRGIWEALTMEGLQYNLSVACAFPPSTDTPGFAVECQRKPPLTKAIEDTTDFYSSDEIAEGILDGIEQGKIRITFGYMGWLLGVLTAGFGPVADPLEVLQDVFLLPIGRIAAVVLSLHWSKIIRNASTKSKLEQKKIN